MSGYSSPDSVAGYRDWPALEPGRHGGQDQQLGHERYISPRRVEHRSSFWGVSCENMCQGRSRPQSHFAAEEPVEDLIVSFQHLSDSDIGQLGAQQRIFLTNIA